jgi:AcrR family transcriptional regulator
MSIKERKEREKDEMRELILNAASEIIAKDGMEKLSIRKIAALIDYSPAIIYHYFQDKEHIVNEIMKKNYEKIVRTVSAVEVNIEDPKEKIKQILRNYIEVALAMSEEYIAIMLNSSSMILEHTTVLFKGSSKKRRAIGILCENLKEVHKNMDEDTIELTAQMIWTSIFGLTVRLIIESDLDENQKKKLIEYHLTAVIDPLLS